MRLVFMLIKGYRKRELCPFIDTVPLKIERMMMLIGKQIFALERLEHALQYDLS